MIINFYSCADDPRVLNKNLVPVTSKNCTVYGSNSTEKPRIKLKYDAALNNANYCYIADFGRYYTFEMDLKPDGAVELICNCDFRLSYKEDIKRSVGRLIRSSNGSNLIPDPLAVRQANNQYKVRNLGSCFTPKVTYIVVKGN